MSDTKPFAWSYSALKNFETCAKRYYHYNVARDVTEPETDQLREGNRLHAAFDARLSKGTALPLGLGHHEWLLAKIIASPGETVSERKLALTSTFEPQAYFGKGVWFRTVIDAAKILPTIGRVFDWKTGKPSEDLTQLQLMALTLFAHMPALLRVKAGLVFVAHDKVETAEFDRGDITSLWSEILPRVNAVKRARETQTYPPRPSGLCKKYCAVMSCPYHGKGA